MIALGIAFPFLEQEDIEIWIENGFLGKSPNYWGGSINGYDWTEPRKDFINRIFVDSQNANSKEKESRFYQLEFQKLNSLLNKPVLSRVNKNEIRISHPNINSPSITETIKVTQKLVLDNNDVYYLDSELPITYEQEGSAIITLPNK